MPIALAAGACSHSSHLVRSDDTTFPRAQSRLASTAALVDQLRPSPQERVLYLQAEGLYRYRFDFPERRFRTYLAQTAAVALELPVFEAVAGSLDLIDLRLRMCDGAVHFWETLLARHPATPLRDLVLYRLGWAYRSVGVGGFPRESGDEAWDELIAREPRSNLVSLASEAKRMTFKSKDRATALSLIPGAGQMYVGEYGNGAARLAVALASVAAIAAPVGIAYARRNDLTWGRDWPLLATAVAGIIVLNVDYTLSYQDAMRGVVQWNERVESAFEARHPEAP